LTGVDEITRHEDPSVNCSLPDVVVLSKYVPSALAVHVPVTWREPETGADGHPAPTDAKSSSPATFKHDDVTVQVPSTSPPHGATLEQEPVAPPLPELPPVATAPPRPELPPVTAPPLLELPPVVTTPPLLELPAAPPLLELPAAPPLLDFPPVPDELRELELLQAPEISPNAIAIARAADWTFIEHLLPRGA
jgi:hypothetical protein